MNYTRYRLLRALIKHLKEDGDSVSVGKMLDGLRKYVKVRRLEASQCIESNNSLATCSGEWEFLDYLQWISEGNGGAAFLSEVESVICRSYPEFKPPRIKVVFFVQEYSLWASYRSIYEALKAVGDVEISLVYAYSENQLPERNKDENISMYRQDGYHVVDMRDYDFTQDEPDIVFYQKPYLESNGIPAKYYIKEVSKHVRYTVFVSYCLDVQGGKDLFRFFYAMPMFYYAWKVVAYSDHYYKMLAEYSYRDAENLVKLGHPKLDAIPSIINDKSLENAEWDSIIRNRRCILWNSHFTIEDGVGVGTFFENKEVIFDYFKNHKDVVLIWRPHPYFWNKVIQDSRMGEEALQELLTDLSELGNVVVDRGGDYRTAFYYADALISDAATFLVEFALSKKPVLYTPKDGGETIIEEAYLRDVEICSENADIEAFIEKVRLAPEALRTDPQHLEEEFGASDGKNGERISTCVLTSMENDIAAFWDRLLS